MKNIHLLPTDKPSKLYKVNNKLYFEEFPVRTVNAGNQYLYITSDEQIKDGFIGWFICPHGLKKCVGTIVINNEVYLLDYLGSYDRGIWCKKIILTTDQDLINDGVQPIDDEFLEWFVQNPSCEEVEIAKIDTFKKTNEVYVDETTGGNYYEIIKHNKIIIPKEEPKQEIDLTNLCYYDKRNPNCSVYDEDIEDHKRILLKKNIQCSCDNCFYGRTELTEQLIWQAERMYSAMSLVMKAHESTNHRYNSEFDLDAEITKLNTPDRYDNVKQKYNYSESDIVNLFEQLKNKS